MTKDNAPASAAKRAPVQRLTGGIPWDMHLRAYEVYVKRYGEQKALIDLEGRGCRGGFAITELDDFIPGWRDELERTENVRLVRDRRHGIGRLEYLTTEPTNGND